MLKKVENNQNKKILSIVQWHFKIKQKIKVVFNDQDEVWLWTYNFLQNYNLVGITIIKMKN